MVGPEKTGGTQEDDTGHISGEHEQTLGCSFGCRIAGFRGERQREWRSSHDEEPVEGGCYGEAAEAFQYQEESESYASNDVDYYHIRQSSVLFILIRDERYYQASYLFPGCLGCYQQLQI